MIFALKLSAGRRRKTMRTIAIAATLAVGLAVPVLAAAQANRAGPVGHRQPSAKDVPRDPANPPVQMTKEDRALKGICRGC
jgi:hypothetical protein